MFERLTTEARAAVERSRREAKDLGHHHIGTEHLLLSLLDGDSPSPGVAASILGRSGITRDRVLEQIRQFTAPGPLGQDEADALAVLGIDLDAVRARVDEQFGTGAFDAAANGHRRCRTGGTGWRTPFTPRAKKVLELSLRESLRLRQRHIGTEHLLLGLLRDGEGLAVLVLRRLGVDLGELRRSLSAAVSEAA